jgi:hypothetical protein
MARMSKKKVTTYETVSSNIQKITSPSGTINYRVRVGYNGEVLSQYASSLKKAKAVRAELLG